ncbi:MAG: AI-2E family transporter [Gammaproteobacteria bacterium]|nr:AI-2E family transporter [Gammaproteobacteria bacterium]
MITTLRTWYERYFSDPEAVILAVLLLVSTLVVVYFGGMLAPVIASLVIAFVLEGMVRLLERMRVPRLPAVLLVFTLFMAVLLLVLFWLLPLLSKQLTQLVGELPRMVTSGQNVLMQLPERYPQLISPEQLAELNSTVRAEIAELGQSLLSYSLASIVGLLTLLVYLVLMPLLVFFFLKDKQKLLGWISRYLPRERGLTSRVWADVEVQIANYVRGKFIEIMIVWSVTYATFAIMGLSYALTLSLAVGLSVIIPYVGAVVVTLPIVLVAFFQWGFAPDFYYVVIAYLVIQALDGNVLVPLLFSEVVNLHPVAIIVAVLFFGGIWGLWGVFFAIPLATLVQALLATWPRAEPRADGGEEGAGA